MSAVIFAGIFLFKGWFLLQSGATDGAGWRHLPGWAAIIVSCFFLFIMACAEGLQVSALALAKTDCTTFKDTKPLSTWEKVVYMVSKEDKILPTPVPKR